jgi:hypothetical protein
MFAKTTPGKHLVYFWVFLCSFILAEVIELFKIGCSIFCYSFESKSFEDNLPPFFQHGPLFIARLFLKNNSKCSFCIRPCFSSNGSAWSCSVKSMVPHDYGKSQQVLVVLIQQCQQHCADFLSLTTAQLWQLENWIANVWARFSRPFLKILLFINPWRVWRALWVSELAVASS